MSYQLKLQILKLNGWSDEKLSVELGELLAGDGPSTQTIYRWRTGKTRPTKVFQKALDRLFTKNSPNGDSNENHQSIEQH